MGELWLASRDLVRMERLELSRLTALPPQSSVSTSSTTSAFRLLTPPPEPGQAPDPQPARRIPTLEAQVRARARPESQWDRLAPAELAYGPSRSQAPPFPG